MTYLLYMTWVFVVALAFGEVDRLISHRLFARYQIPLPDVHWSVPPFASALLPGIGQFLNGQPIKALFLFLWALIAIGSPALRPWQLIFLPTKAIFFVFWIVAVVDALQSAGFAALSRFLRNRGEGDDRSAIRASQAPDQLAAYLARRNQPKRFQ